MSCDFSRCALSLWITRSFFSLCHRRRDKNRRVADAAVYRYQKDSRTSGVPEARTAFFGARRADRFGGEIIKRFTYTTCVRINTCINVELTMNIEIRYRDTAILAKNCPIHVCVCKGNKKKQTSRTRAYTIASLCYIIGIRKRRGRHYGRGAEDVDDKQMARTKFVNKNVKIKMNVVVIIYVYASFVEFKFIRTHAPIIILWLFFTR